MRKHIMSAMAAALAVTAFVTPAAHADSVSDRNAAITLCKNEVAARAGAEPAQIRLDQARVHGRTVRIDLDLWRNGELTNVRCDVNRGAELVIAALSPDFNTAQAAR